MRDFVFDQDTNINVDALEAYLNANKNELIESENEVNIDLSSMMVRGNYESKSDTSIISTQASEGQ